MRPLVRIRAAGLCLLWFLLVSSASLTATPLFDHLSYRDGLTDSAISSIVQDDEGFLWFGSQSGLHRYDGFSMRVFESEPFNTGSISHQLVQTLHYGDDDALWIGTNGGLNRYRPQTDDFTRYRYDPHNPRGISSNSVAQIKEDSLGRIWTATRAGGLVRYHRERDEFSHITTADGLATRNFGGGATRTAAGDLLFGAFSKVVRMPPQTFANGGTAPPVRITEVTVMGEPYPSASVHHRLDAIELPYERSSVQLQFAALEYSLPHRNEYRYRLRGLDDDWVDAGTRRFVDYPNLAPGSYIFEVIAADSRGTWSRTPATLRITVSPPFWRTSAFTAALVFVAILLVWLVLQLRTRAFRRQTRMLEQQVAERTAALHQVNQKLREANASKDRFFSILAHDLRGPITGLRSVMEPVAKRFSDFTGRELREVCEAVLDTAVGLESMLENLLEWAQLQSGKLKLHPQEVTVCELVTAVLDAYQGTACSKSITLRSDCPDDAVAWVDPHAARSMLVNLVHNALKFTSEGGTVAVEAETAQLKDVRRTRILVRDSGTGIPAEKLQAIFRPDEMYRRSGTAGEKGSGLGLMLCHELARRSNGSITIDSADGAGTTVVLEFPAAAPRAQQH